jgi:steroid 5-alpha reductase family enzyme
MYSRVKKMNKSFSLAIAILVYLLALLVACYTFSLITFNDMIISILIADVAATVVVFIFSLVFRNSSVYDPYWSVAPPFIAIYLLIQFPQGNNYRQFILLTLVLLWSIRLTANWVRSWQGLRQQDWRYSYMAEKTGR